MTVPFNLWGFKGSFLRICSGICENSQTSRGILRTVENSKAGFYSLFYRKALPLRLISCVSWIAVYAA